MFRTAAASLVRRCRYTEMVGVMVAPISQQLKAWTALSDPKTYITEGASGHATAAVRYGNRALGGCSPLSRVGAARQHEGNAACAPRANATGAEDQRTSRTDDPPNPYGPTNSFVLT